MITDYREVLKKSAETIKDQDNRCTAEPIYLVQQKKRLYGVDPDIVDDSEIVWLDGENDCCEIDGDERATLEALYQETFTVPAKYHRTGYADQWEFVQPFFTEAAAEAYITANSHRMSETRIYVDSGYRNYEWQAVRAMLLEKAKKTK
jgi:hypothetical protein